jgi:hypothetical protein
MFSVPRVVAASSCLLFLSSAMAGPSNIPFQDAQNRVWSLSVFGGQRFSDMASVFDPGTGFAYDGSGLRWATRSEVSEFTAQIGQVSGQDFFDRYPCTYSTGSCNPTIDIWTTNPGYGPTPFGFAVFGGVVREPLYLSDFYSPAMVAQTNMFVSRSFEVVGYAPEVPPDQWYLSYTALTRSGGNPPADFGEVTEQGTWVYTFVPAPATFGLFGLGLAGIAALNRGKANSSKRHSIPAPM